MLKLGQVRLLCISFSILIVSVHSMNSWMKTSKEWTLGLRVLLISFKKLFFPKFELLNSRCGLSAVVYGNQPPQQ